jgi:hypothetical protein
MKEGAVRPIGMADFEQVLTQISPSTRAWFAAVRNVVTYGNQTGDYDDLLSYLSGRKLL